MDNNFDYESVPWGYAHCFNERCVKREECLRHLVAKHCTPAHDKISIVNPACLPEDTSACTFFSPIQKIRIAWGISHVLDRVPHSDAKKLKSQLLVYFGRTRYYQIYRKERGIFPEQQEYIHRIFQKKGISGEIAFDSYTEEYRLDRSL